MPTPDFPVPFQRQRKALDALDDAQRIAFGPMVFHCVRLAWKRGLLAALEPSAGLSSAELAALCSMSVYATDVLLESCLSAGVVSFDGDRYRLAKAGHFVLNDRMTQINFDFVHDVCYCGMNELENSLATGQPLGLRALGDWPTLYEAMTRLPEPARSSWFAFDHFYSDAAFAQLLPIVFETAPRRLLDVGANTGRWARSCLEYSPNVQLTLVDLPRQLEVAAAQLHPLGHAARIQLEPRDLLDPHCILPAGQDVVWMSQFLSCFGKKEIEAILRRALDALAPGGRLHLLDTFWDRQRFETSAYCLINTSPYFTTMASGTSKMYRASEYIECADKAGFRLLKITDEVGICHSLLTFTAGRGDEN